VVATLGNWEHWGEIPVRELARTYADAGARLLVNEAHDWDGSLHVVATDDSTAGNPKFVRHATRPAHASLFLTHSPHQLDLVPDGFGRFDLALAGHTHGGQIRLGPHFTPALPPGGGRFVAGFYNAGTGRTYVSRGTGTSLIPARFTCRPELPIFSLRQG
jgi:predicted MPP superfamily phosphohydrolase